MFVHMLDPRQGRSTASGSIQRQSEVVQQREGLRLYRPGRRARRVCSLQRDPTRWIQELKRRRRSRVRHRSGTEGTSSRFRHSGSRSSLNPGNPGHSLTSEKQQAGLREVVERPVLLFWSPPPTRGRSSKAVRKQVRLRGGAKMSLLPGAYPDFLLHGSGQGRVRALLKGRMKFQAPPTARAMQFISEGLTL